MAMDARVSTCEQEPEMQRRELRADAKSRTFIIAQECIEHVSGAAWSVTGRTLQQSPDAAVEAARWYTFCGRLAFQWCLGSPGPGLLCRQRRAPRARSILGSSHTAPRHRDRHAGRRGVMPRVCTICTHPDRPAVERALRGRTPLRTIATRWSVSKTALLRHRDAHMPRAPVLSQPAEPAGPVV